MPSTEPADSSNDVPSAPDDASGAAAASIRNMMLTDIISGVKRRNGAHPMLSSAKRRKPHSAPDDPSEQGQAPATPSAPSSPPQDEAPSEEAVAPQVTLDAEGNIVIDPDSLVVSADTAGAFDDGRRTVTVDNDGLGNRITSATYGKRESALRWSQQETDKFYQALRMFGTDFSLMERLFPKRSRRQLKFKFKREDKENPKRVDEALNAPPLPIPQVQASTPAAEGSQVTGADGVTGSARGQQESCEDATVCRVGDDTEKEADEDGTAAVP
eukprot:GFKZ01007380.1.p1 GENE.GFKZ01007380.1~~GFKZ01007380.1.p1  ORF type:complete len:316 (-),score=40.24 GFKZ01007380.1:15-827(-)